MVGTAYGCFGEVRGTFAFVFGYGAVSINASLCSLVKRQLGAQKEVQHDRDCFWFEEGLIGDVHAFSVLWFVDRIEQRVADSRGGKYARGQAERVNDGN